MLVGAKGELRAGEGGDEKKQGGVGEVEVGEEALDPFEFIRGIDIGGGRPGVAVAKRLSGPGKVVK